MEEINQNPFLDVVELGELLRLKKRQLGKMRWMGNRPSVRYHGGCTS
jgi:hypothetical protein